MLSSRPASQYFQSLQLEHGKLSCQSTGQGIIRLYTTMSNRFALHARAHLASNFVTSEKSVTSLTPATDVPVIMQGLL
eukprot:42106-Eustigmatos_ZCMA.PRE.1